MRPVRITKTLTVADADGIAQSQTPLAAGNLTLNGDLTSGGVAILDSPRQILFTFAANESAKTFTVYGFDKPTGGSPISEAVTGTASTAVTQKGFGRVDRVATSAATTGALTVGTNGVGWTSWQTVDGNIGGNVLINIDVVGTVNYTVQYTLDDIMGEWIGGTFVPGIPTRITDDATLASATADGHAAIITPVNAWRVQTNSGNGSLRITGTQAGMAGVGGRSGGGGAGGAASTTPAITIDHNTIAENLTSTVVGTLQAVNVSGTPSFSLVDDAGGLFSLAGDVITGVGPFDYEVTPSYNIQVSVTGVTPAIPNALIAIQITDVADYPQYNGTLRPVITGLAQEGQTLSVDNGSVLGDQNLTYTYQWYELDMGVGLIVGATNNTYVITAGNVGHFLQCYVVATNTAGSLPMASNLTARVTANPSSSAGTPTGFLFLLTKGT